MQTEEESGSGNATNKNDTGISTSSRHAVLRARVSAIYRQSNIASARKDGDQNTLHITADSMFMSISHRYKNSQNPIEHFECDMHDLWHTYYVASKHISSNHPALDRLVLQIVTMQKQGVLTRSKLHPDIATGLAQDDEALTSDGRIWADLPFLVGDMTEYWVADFPKMSAAQRLSFSQFLSMLASLGLVAGNGLCSIGLVVLRDTLETVRPLGEGVSDHGADDQSEDDHRTIQDITTAALLPAANAWLFWAGPKLIQLSDQNWSLGEPEIGAAGELFGGSRNGFSLERWIYWLIRIEEIANAGAIHHNNVSEYVGKMVRNMLAIVEDADNTSLVKRAVQDRREVSHTQAHV